jgi:hypothetical protein
VLAKSSGRRIPFHLDASGRCQSWKHQQHCWALGVVANPPHRGQ